MMKLSQRRATLAASAGIVVAIVVFGLIPFQGERPVDVWFPIALGVGALALMFRDRWPLAVLVICVAVLVAATFFTRATPAYALPVAIALFAYANRRSRVRTTIAAAVTAAILVSLTWIVAGTPILDPRVILLPVTVIAAAAAGDATRSRRVVIAAITDRAVRAEQALAAEASRQVAEERLRIARDLHDVVAHQMTVINLHAGVASAAVSSNPEQAVESLSTIGSAARAVLSEIGQLLSVLRTDGSSQSGTDSPVAFDRVDDLVTQFESLGLSIDRRTVGDPVPLPGAVDVVAFRVVQEALTNAQKHGSSGRASLGLGFDERSLAITVENPVGRRMPVALVSSGHGLVGMRERVESVNGTLDVASTAGGFRVSVRLPLAIGASS